MIHHIVQFALRQRMLILHIRTRYVRLVVQARRA
jgi:hypothetical protein